MLASELCLTLSDPVDGRLPGSSVHGILENTGVFSTPRILEYSNILQYTARILEWVLFPSPGDLPDQGSHPDLPHFRQILYHLGHQESLQSPRVCSTSCPLSQ